MTKRSRLTTSSVDQVIGSNYSFGSTYESHPSNETVSRPTDTQYSQSTENIRARTIASKRHELIAQINQELKKLKKK